MRPNSVAKGQAFSGAISGLTRKYQTSLKTHVQDKLLSLCVNENNTSGRCLITFYCDTEEKAQYGYVWFLQPLLGQSNISYLAYMTRACPSRGPFTHFPLEQAPVLTRKH